MRPPEASKIDVRVTSEIDMPDGGIEREQPVELAGEIGKRFIDAGERLFGKRLDASGWIGRAPESAHVGIKRLDISRFFVALTGDGVDAASERIEIAEQMPVHR